MSAAHLKHFQETIAEAAAEERPWADVCPALTQLIGARTISLWVGDPGAGRVAIIGTSFGPEVERQYSERYHQHDLWTHRGAARAREGAFLGTDLVTEAELRNAEVYADFFLPIGLFQLASATQSLGIGRDLLFLGLHRPEGDRPFEEATKATLDDALPLLTRGPRLRQRLKEATGAANLALAGIEALGAAALICDAGGRIIHANGAARLLLGAGRGLASRGGRCTASHPADAVPPAALPRSAAAARCRRHRAGAAAAGSGGAAHRPQGRAAARPPRADLSRGRGGRVGGAGPFRSSYRSQAWHVGSDGARAGWASRNAARLSTGHRQF